MRAERLPQRRAGREVHGHPVPDAAPRRAFWPDTCRSSRTDLQRDAPRRYDGFRLQFEGRARVNEVEGYQFAFTGRGFRGRAGEPRQLFGRIVVLPEPYDYEDPEQEHPPGKNPTRGVLITMLATTLDEPDSPTRVGDEGILQRPFRSFRFGTD